LDYVDYDLIEAQAQAQAEALLLVRQPLQLNQTDPSLYSQQHNLSSSSSSSSSSSLSSSSSSSSSESHAELYANLTHSEWKNVKFSHLIDMHARLNQVLLNIKESNHLHRQGRYNAVGTIRA